MFTPISVNEADTPASAGVIFAAALAMYLVSMVSFPPLTAIAPSVETVASKSPEA